MAIFGNFKGTTQPSFTIGKRGPAIFGTPPDGLSGEPTGIQGDFWIDPANHQVKVYSSVSANVSWRSIGAHLSDLNVDNGTLFVDTANDTVSIGSTSSNEKLFVNGSLRLGTNPAIKYSGAYLDLKHANGTGTVVRIRDNTGNTNPTFKVYNANNTSEVFKVQGSNITINSAYTLPTSDGTAGYAIVTDGSGNLSFSSVGGDAVTDYGYITEANVTTLNYGTITGDARTPVSHPSYTVSEAGAIAGSSPGDMIFVSNEEGGATMAFYDGSDWRRVQDRQVISEVGVAGP